GEPGGGAFRHAVARPCLECRDQGVLDAVLGQIEVMEAPDQGRGDTCSLLPKDVGHGGRDVGGAARHPPQRCTTAGRISTAPPPRHDLAMARASSRSAAPTSGYPPTSPFPSTNGPAVTIGRPPWNETVVAVSGPCSWFPWPSRPWCSANHRPTWAYRSRSSSGVSASNAAWSAAVPQNRNTYFICSPPAVMTNDDPNHSTTTARSSIQTIRSGPRASTRGFCRPRAGRSTRRPLGPAARPRRLLQPGCRRRRRLCLCPGGHKQVSHA